MRYHKGDASLKRTVRGLLLALALAAVAAAIVTGPAHAEEQLLTWEGPTHCTNGAALGEEGCPALTEYTAHCSSEGPGGPYTLAWSKPAPAQSDIRDYAPGDYWCVLTASNAEGASDVSGELFFHSAIADAVPNAPVNVTASPVDDSG